MSFVPPWNELMTPEGGLEGGMQGLLAHLRKHSLNTTSLRSNYSEELCGILSRLLAKKATDRLPLKQLLSQLTEAPKYG